MQASARSSEIDPLMRYLLNQIGKTEARPAENIARPITVPAEYRRHPLAPWTANAPSTRRWSSSDEDDWNSYIESRTRQTHEDAQWELDSIQENLLHLRRNEGDDAGSGHKSGPAPKDVQSHQFFPRNPTPHRLNTPPKLKFPVIIPQRQPKDRSRGFIKGYAPALSNHGISETTFVDFLERFEEKTDDPVYLSTLNLANDGLPSPRMADWPLLVAIDLETLNVELKEPGNQQKRNILLEDVNNELFRPNGLYCLATSYMPDSAEGYNRINLHSPAELHSSYGSVGQHRHVPAAIRKSRENNFTMEAAPLVFPGLEQCRGQPDRLLEALKGKPTKTQQLVHDYYCYSRDRQGLEESHNRSIFVERSRQTVMTRYSLPTYVATSGSFMSLLSGQYIKPPPMTRVDTGTGKGVFKSQRRQTERESAVSMEETVRRTADLSMTRVLSVIPTQDTSRADRASSARVATTSLKKNIVYLMVINMPPDEQLDAVREDVERRKKDGAKFRRIVAQL